MAGHAWWAEGMPHKASYGVEPDWKETPGKTKKHLQNRHGNGQRPVEKSCGRGKGPQWARRRRMTTYQKDVFKKYAPLTEYVLTASMGTTCHDFQLATITHIR